MDTSYTGSNYKNKTQNTLDKITNGIPCFLLTRFEGGGGRKKTPFCNHSKTKNKMTTPDVL